MAGALARVFRHIDADDRVESAAKGRSIGSLRYGEPAGTEAVGLPENSTCRSVPGRMLPFWSASATRTAPMASGLVPYSLVRRSRSRDPPTLTLIVWRMV